MKYLTVVFLLLLMSCGSDSSDDTDQNCNPSFNIIDGVLMGDLQLTSQEDIDEFDWSCINAINGNLTIRTITPSLDEPISDISNLSALVRIGGLFVYDNESLSSLEALQNITAFDSEGNMNIYIDNNPLLTSLDGLQNFPTFVGNIFITENENLTSINALSQITHAVSVFISENHTLTSLLGLQNLTFVSSVSISDNDMLTNLIGMPSFNAIQSIDANGLRRITINSNANLVSLEGVNGTSLNGKLNIYSNDNLITLSHLNGLTRTDRIDLDENDLLTSLDGLESLILVDGPLQIFRNISLSDFCAIESLANNGTINGPLGVSQCAYNPTLESIQMGNCSN